jgi:hypothetical protein
MSYLYHLNLMYDNFFLNSLTIDWLKLWRVRVEEDSWSKKSY